MRTRKEERPDPGNRIREVREARGKSQAELAAALGVRQETISAYETGRAAPPLGKLRALAAALEATIDELFPLEGAEAGKAGKEEGQ